MEEKNVQLPKGIRVALRPKNLFSARQFLKDCPHFQTPSSPQFPVHSNTLPLTFRSPPKACLLAFRSIPATLGIVLMFP
jgi:hypothetical protein